mmetsp:Transcript_52386/g.60172  ORF Transcript_52386/g.60172 Transcript_52386/m.60172 type:complete len:666 (-) Transcript_52386:64-2061(-)
MQQQLEISAVIGFKGTVPEGLILHPDNEHLLFPLGSTVVVRHILSRSQTFLRGHDNQISVIAVSPTGKYVASGQKTFMGFQADIIVWDFEERSLLYRLKLHKVAIQSLTFSFNELYLASLGGQDDKSGLVIWELETGKALLGTSLGGQHIVQQIKYFNKTDEKIIAVTNIGVQIVVIEKEARKIRTIDVSLGSLKRKFLCCALDADDQFAYCGTQTGDLLEVNVERAIYKRLGPVKKLFSLGVQTIGLLPNGDIIAGAGDGTVAKISIQDMQIKFQTQVLGGVTSISFTGDYTHFFCGTNQSNIYWIDADKLVAELRNTCHHEKINDIAFPYNYSDVFATCSVNDIRVWNAKNRQELLRIQVPNLECNCVAFMNDGKSILGGWNDGKIRAFLPQSGKLMYVINDAHIHGVTAMTTTSDCQRIISGGMEGEVRVWKIGRQTQTMEASLKEHRGTVWSIQVRKNNDQAVSASADGSCIIWDLRTFTRLTCLFESTLFKQVLYHPEESQLITTGSDRKITYWTTYDGQAIRMIDGSEESEVNALAITKEGEHFASGGLDKLVKLWGYDEGLCYYVGVGHSGGITRIAIAPDQKTIVSVGEEGAIFIWKTPEEVIEARADKDLPTMTKDQFTEQPEKTISGKDAISQKSGGKSVGGKSGGSGAISKTKK